MYAVVEINNNQFIVKKDDEIFVDKLNEDTKKKEVQTDNVLLLKDKNRVLVGKPYLNNVTIRADFVKDIKGRKITVFKYKKRKKYRKKQGHRQGYTVIKIKDIIVK